MRFDAFAPMIASLFGDKMDIFRSSKTTNSDSTTDVTYPSTATHTNVVCKLSFEKMENPSDSEVDQNPINFLPKIFCAVGTDIQAGDYIIGYRLDDDGVTLVTYTGYAGLPSVFRSHLEVPMLVKESA